MDYVLIQLIRNGNMKAWHRLYKLYCPRVHGFVSRMVPEKWAVDEIVQNVFVKIWSNRNRIIPEKGSGDGLSGYIFMVYGYKYQELSAGYIPDILYELLCLGHAAVRIRSHLQEKI